MLSLTMSDTSADSDRVAADDPALQIVKIILALALLGSLIFAGWRVYRALPPGADQTPPADATAAKSQLTINLRETVSGAQTNVELYPIDYAATQKEFVLQGRPGKSFDEYLAQRLQKLSPVRVKIDQGGRASASLSEGQWWLRATCASGNDEMMEWRLPITIAQSANTVELSSDNAYARTKKF